MGNVLGSKPSSLKEPHETWSFGFGGHNVPKHLRPSKQAKKTLKSSKSSQETKPEEPPEIDDSDRIDRLVRAISSSDNENQGDESAQNNYTVDPLFSPGPQGAFRWFKGRRFAISSKRFASE
ncbi:hypothetical protein CLU79DRAFT_493359 [Phycomyces nitens]|nr:hypothetical protein CLU79DRAFT_493359 [Phycomyces nitens]